MNISSIDWLIVGVFFLLTLLIGLISFKQAGKSFQEFFLSGRNMPWWLLGVSMVATTFSADTPNLVTDIVRTNGVAGNWAWWAFLLTGMLTVFVYARLWRRSGIATDLEFYELRYSGKPAAFLRAFRALYLGVFFNVVIMATVLLAGVKFGSIVLGWGMLQTLIIVSLVTVAYSMLGGLRGVILTDFFQFTLAMGGMIAAAVYIVNLPQIGGVSSLLSHELVSSKIDFFPDFTRPDIYIPLLLIPLAVQWWSVWYPGAEPGGGGYVAQRMLAARSEKQAMAATLFFNFAHYALRPWPWILIALASLIVFPDLADIKSQFPNVDESIVKHDLAFPAMLSLLPKGLLGLVIAALIAALMSTISTHLNWGSSYVVNDFYLRFINPTATQRRQVAIGRLSTLLLMIFAAALVPYLENAKKAFDLMLQIGAGTGLIFILRWFWWRINAWSEIAAMVVSLIVAVYFSLVYQGDMAGHWQLVSGVGITTAAWIGITFMTKVTDIDTLRNFYQLIRPYPLGWMKVMGHDKAMKVIDHTHSLGHSIGLMLAGTFGIYCTLFAVGFLVYGKLESGLISLTVAMLMAGYILRKWSK